MIFGISAIELAVFSFFPIFGIFFLGASITLIVLSFTMRSKFLSQYGIENGFTRAGRICSVVAIPVVSFFGLYGMIFNFVLLFAPV